MNRVYTNDYWEFCDYYSNPEPNHHMTEAVHMDATDAESIPNLLRKLKWLDTHDALRQQLETTLLRAQGMLEVMLQAESINRKFGRPTFTDAFHDEARRLCGE